ncbi:cupin [Pseudactinotalea sp. Z1748]|uniref:cupin n=1 Tax=Pseudactinotalea sp. Z1748 TaxID=3413027 RepID=UPI003C7A2FE3
MANLDDLCTTHVEAARADPHGRSAELIVRDGFLRQSVIAMCTGTELAEHNSPHAASIQVLTGRVLVTSLGERDVEVAEGHLQVLTHERHAVRALTDSVFLLTTVTSVGQQDGPERGV